MPETARARPRRRTEGRSSAWSRSARHPRPANVHPSPDLHYGLPRADRSQSGPRTCGRCNP
eukprot:5914606-Pyramimonas_sp.AAC.1